MKKGSVIGIVTMAFLTMYAGESPLLTSAQKDALAKSPSIAQGRQRAWSAGMTNFSLEAVQAKQQQLGRLNPSPTLSSPLQKLLSGNSSKEQESPK